MIMDTVGFFSFWGDCCLAISLLAASTRRQSMLFISVTGLITGSAAVEKRKGQHSGVKLLRPDDTVCFMIVLPYCIRSRMKHDCFRGFW